MGTSEATRALVDPAAQRGTVPHLVDYSKPLCRTFRCWGSLTLSGRSREQISDTLRAHMLPTSWSTALRFNFSWENPSLSTYLQRAVNVSAVAFSHFSGMLPFSSNIVLYIGTSWEMGHWLSDVFRDILNPSSVNAFTLHFLFVVLLLPMMYATELWADESKLMWFTMFQCFFLTNCLYTRALDKPEHDLKLQLANLQQLLKEHPELETNLELLHSDPEALDKAFVDNEGKPILFPFYQVMRGDDGPVRRYLTQEEFYALLKTNTDPSLEIYCDRARFQKILTIFRNAQTPNP